MKKNPAQTVARRARRERALGEFRFCVLCPASTGITDPAALIAVPRDRIPSKVFEEHHALGRRTENAATVTVCRNHHAILHERYLAGGIDLKQQPSTLHVLLVVLQSLVEFLRELADSLELRAATLSRLITLLDERLPEWRGLENAL